MLSKDLSLWWNLAQGTTRLPVLKHVLDGTVFWSCGERHDKQDGRERCMGIEEDLGSVPGVCVWEEPGRIGSRRSWERHGVMIYFCSGKTGLGGADVQHAKRLIPQSAYNQCRICPELDTHTSLTQEDLAALRFTRGENSLTLRGSGQPVGLSDGCIIEDSNGVLFSAYRLSLSAQRAKWPWLTLVQPHWVFQSGSTVREVPGSLFNSKMQHSWDIIHSNALTSQ